MEKKRPVGRPRKEHEDYSDPIYKMPNRKKLDVYTPAPPEPGLLKFLRLNKYLIIAATIFWSLAIGGYFLFEKLLNFKPF